MAIDNLTARRAALYLCGDIENLERYAGKEALQVELLAVIDAKLQDIEAYLLEMRLTLGVRPMIEGVAA